jgi:hypothetical protein
MFTKTTIKPTIIGILIAIGNGLKIKDRNIIIIVILNQLTAMI